MSVRKKEKLFEKFLSQTNNLVDISIWSGFKSWVSRWWERCEVDNYHIYQSGIHLFEKVLWFLGRSFRTFPLNLPNFWNFSCLLKNLKSSLGSLDVLLYCGSWTTSNKAFWNWRFTVRKHFMNFNFGFHVLVLKTLSPLKAKNLNFNYYRFWKEKIWKSLVCRIKAIKRDLN